MIYILIYVCIGFGFSLASWLQAQEIQVNRGEKIQLSFKLWVSFTILWPILAVYCYRVEVSKTVKPIDIESIKRKVK